MSSITRVGSKTKWFWELKTQGNIPGKYRQKSDHTDAHTVNYSQRSHDQGSIFLAEAEQETVVGGVLELGDGLPAHPRGTRHKVARTRSCSSGTWSRTRWGSRKTEGQRREIKIKTMKQDREIITALSQTSVRDIQLYEPTLLDERYSLFISSHYLTIQSQVLWDWKRQYPLLEGNLAQ